MLLVNTIGPLIYALFPKKASQVQTVKPKKKLYYPPPPLAKSPPPPRDTVTSMFF